MPVTPAAAAKSWARKFALFLILICIPFLFLSSALAISSVEPVHLPSILRGWPPPSPTPSPGRVLISEVLYDPLGDEPEGEWIELFNPGGLPYDLSGYKLGDEERPGEQEGMFQFPANTFLAPHQSLIIANQAAIYKQRYNGLPDFEIRSTNPDVPDLEKYSSWARGNIELVNSGDEVLLLDPFDTIIDAVSWGNSYDGLEVPVRSVPDGHSIERFPVDIDTDTAGDWRDQLNPSPWSATFSTPTPTLTRTPRPSPTLTQTPGLTTTLDIQTPAPTTGEGTAGPSPTAATEVPEPHPGLLISEVLYTTGALEPQAEWVELYNASLQAIDLSGFMIADRPNSPAQTGAYLKFPQGLILNPEQVIVIAGSAVVYKRRYGTSPDFEIAESETGVTNLLPVEGCVETFHLSNEGDSVFIFNAASDPVDQLSWGFADGLFNPAVSLIQARHSLERYPARQDTDTADDWRDQIHPSPGLLP